MEPAVVAEDVRRSYGDTVALDGVSLSIDPGEVFGLVGPNGAGKTTLVRALTGTTEPDAGRVRLLGGDPGSVARERVGLLPQEFRPHERLTARELLDYYRGLYEEGRDPSAVLADVGLAGSADTRYENLSGGQRRRVCVGTALVNDPDVLFLDEPTTGIDPAGRRALWELVEGLAAGGTAVCLTTHHMAEAERLADRVGLLADGALAAVGTPAELVAAHGGRPRLSVETDADPTDLADSDGAAEFVVRRADESGGPPGGADGYVVAGSEDGLVFPGIEPTEIGDVVAALEARGVEYGALAWREPGLEDVYLSLTGREFVAGPGGRAGVSEEVPADPERATADPEHPAPESGRAAADPEQPAAESEQAAADSERPDDAVAGPGGSDA